jgi:hypothetical protein
MEHASYTGVACILHEQIMHIRDHIMLPQRDRKIPKCVNRIKVFPEGSVGRI